jgi:drug/metabolite transporter (DMT)-like permease
MPSADLVVTLVSVGDSGAMIPAATAITALLFGSRLQRPALYWALLYISGVALVAASKIAFLAWGTGIRAIDLKALSGHAMQTAAVAPVLCYLLLHKRTRAAQVAGTLLGFAFAGVMGVLLTVFGYHSLTESFSGFALGSAVSVAFLRFFRKYEANPNNPVVLALSIAVFLAAWLCWSPAFELLIRDAALHLSGRNTTYSYQTWHLHH